MYADSPGSQSILSTTTFYFNKDAFTLFKSLIFRLNNEKTFYVEAVKLVKMDYITTLKSLDSYKHCMEHIEAVDVALIKFKCARKDCIQVVIKRNLKY